jgi:hypothetical protein
MIRTPIDGTNADGSQRYDYELTQEELDDGFVAFITGPISGTVALPDGTAYDVSEPAIPVRRHHVGELLVAVHRAHHAAGRFLDEPVPDVDAVALRDDD